MNSFVPRRSARRTLRFAPLAYLKMLYLCHAGPTEVGAYGISAENDLLYVQDVVTVRQECTPVTVNFLDEAVADHFDRCADAGIPPQRCGRVWLHTHPGGSALPSWTDEETFARAFGVCDWAVMAILAKGGSRYARLQVNTGPGVTKRLRWSVDWQAWPEALAIQDLAALRGDWAREHAENIMAFVNLALPLASLRPWRLGRDEPEATLPPNPELGELDDWYASAFWNSYPDYYGDDHVHSLP
jgi:hypothetical protein